MSIFKVGQYVRIRKDFTQIPDNAQVGVTSQMERMAGDTLKVVSTSSRKAFKAGGYAWNDSWAVDINEKETPAQKQTKHKCYLCSLEGKDNFDISNFGLVEMYSSVPICIDCFTKVQDVSYVPRKTPLGKKGDHDIIQSDRTFGVELECFTRTQTNSDVARFLYHKSFDTDSDGSIREDSGYQVDREIKTCILRGAEGEHELQKTCDILRSLDFKTNSSCGTHVHIGIPEYNHREMPEKTDEALRNLVLFYTIFDPAVRALLPYERRNTYYARPFGLRGLIKLDKKNKKPIDESEKKLSSLSFRGKYYGINFSPLTEQKTVEIRYHEGTLDGERLTHWIALHTAIVDLVMNGNITEEQIVSFGKIKTTEKLFKALIYIMSPQLHQKSIEALTKRYDELKDDGNTKGLIKDIAFFGDSSLSDDDDDNDDCGDDGDWLF